MSSPSGGLILLAAGSASRFGSDKRQQLLPSGDPLLLSSLRLYLGTYARIVVVLRPGDEALGRELAGSNLDHPNLHLAYATQAAGGMGFSLACGAQRLLAGEPEPYFTVALADMPYVQAATVQQLQQRCLELAAPFILQPTYAGTPGNPVCFSFSYLEDFTRLEGDQGARALLQRNNRQLHRVPVEDPGVLQDIDRPKDILT